MKTNLSEKAMIRLLSKQKPCRPCKPCTENRKVIPLQIHFPFVVAENNREHRNFLREEKNCCCAKKKFKREETGSFGAMRFDFGAIRFGLDAIRFLSCELWKDLVLQ